MKALMIIPLIILCVGLLMFAAACVLIGLAMKIDEWLSR